VQGSSSKSGAGGTGLGLAISQQIVVDHGGRIWATSSEQGAAFHIELPLGAPDDSGAGEAPPHGAGREVVR